MTDQTPVCDVSDPPTTPTDDIVLAVAREIGRTSRETNHMVRARAVIAVYNAEAQATIERLTKELEADIVTMAEAGQNLQAQRIKLRALQSDAAIGKAVREQEVGLVECGARAHHAARHRQGFSFVRLENLASEEQKQYREAMAAALKAIASYPHEGGK